MEHAFQAVKCVNEIDVERVRAAHTPANAKSIDRRVQLKSNWGLEKVKMMEKILKVKFADPKMKSLLIKTKDCKIVEKNSWHDTFFGCV